LAYTDIKTSPIDDPIVVDWDLDGVLEVILRTEKGLLLFDFKQGNHFVQMEPSGFESIPPLKEYCRPAVVDWNQDEKPDLVIGAKDWLPRTSVCLTGYLPKMRSSIISIKKQVDCSDY